MMSLSINSHLSCVDNSQQLNINFDKLLLANGFLCWSGAGRFPGGRSKFRRILHHHRIHWRIHHTSQCWHPTPGSPYHSKYQTDKYLFRYQNHGIANNRQIFKYQGHCIANTRQIFKYQGHFIANNRQIFQEKICALHRGCAVSTNIKYQPKRIEFKKHCTKD